jgi:hypothetical protein
MTCWMIYVDESYDSEKFCLSALAIKDRLWRNCFNEIRSHRVALKRSYGVLLRKEIHARDLVAGRGRLGPQDIGKWQRSRIFYDLLKLAGSLPETSLFNVCFDIKGRRDVQLTAWDRLVNRIERTLVEYEKQEVIKRKALIQSISEHVSNEDREQIERRLMVYAPRAVFIADEGHEYEITKALRKMQVYNPIPSAFGTWAGGSRTTNIRVERIIEDPFFKESHRSYFLQLVDCIAFSLLKKEVGPTSNIKKYGVNQMFDDTVSHICYRPAARNDPLGIVRN